MRWIVFLRPAAEDDIEAARAHYQGVTASLGDAFLDDMAEAMLGLQDNPEWPRLYHRGFRRILLKRFPYKIFYLLDEPRVIVFRVLHGRQDHSRWLPK